LASLLEIHQRTFAVEELVSRVEALEAWVWGANRAEKSNALKINFLQWSEDRK